MRRHADVAGDPLDVDRLLTDAARARDALKGASARTRSPKTGGVIDAFNAAHDVGAILEAHGYRRSGRRWLYPHSTTGAPGVRLLPDSTPPRIYSGHADDPLADGHAHDAFDVWRILEHGGDQRAAVRAAAELLGIEREAPPVGVDVEALRRSSKARQQGAARADQDGGEPGKPCLNLATGEHGAGDDDGGQRARLPAPVDLRDLHRAVPTPHKIAHYLPERTVTLLGGHGGAGKSYLGLLAAVCLALGIPFLGHAVKRSRVMFFSCEDDAATLRYRLGRILESLGADDADLRPWLRLYDMTESSPILYREFQRQGMLTPTFDALKDEVEREQIDVCVIDNASDTYDAGENERARVREYLRLLATLVRSRNGAVLLLAHVDKLTAKAGENGEGYSGSTAWNNSVRSRLYLYQNNDVLTLEHRKANHGPLADPVNLAWRDGVPTLLPGAAAADPLIEFVRLRAVLRLIRDFNERGENVTTAPVGPGNVHMILRAEPGYPAGLGRDALLALLREAERGALIEREEYKTDGRKTRERWALTAKGRAECASYAPGADGQPAQEAAA